MQFQEPKKLNFEKLESHKAILTLLSSLATSYAHHNATELIRVNDTDVSSVNVYIRSGGWWGGEGESLMP